MSLFFSSAQHCLPQGPYVLDCHLNTQSHGASVFLITRLLYHHGD